MGLEMRIDCRRWWLALALCVIAPCAWAAPTKLVPPCTTSVKSLAPVARQLAVPKGRLGPGAVLHLSASRFGKVEDKQLLQHEAKDRWMRIDLHNDSDGACYGWLQAGPARLRNVRVYVRQGSGWKVMRGGTAYPFAQWALPERQPVFPILLAPESTTTVLVRVRSDGEMMSLAPQLWNPAYFQRTETHRELRDGMVFGSMLLLMLSSLILAGIYRRPVLAYMALAAGFLPSIPRPRPITFSSICGRIRPS